jgi:DNA-binding LytR/AlgR family response regulator
MIRDKMSNKVIIISNANELVRLRPERVVYIKSDGNYSTIVLHDKTEHVFTMNLAHCQELIEEQLGKEAETFIRIGKQLIINRAYIFKINPTKQQLIMSNMEVNQAIELQASKEALKQLKIYLESTIGKEAML